MNILIGTLIYRQGSYVVNKYLDNQRAIQQKYPQSTLVLATAENDYCTELRRLIEQWGLRGQVLSYVVTRPEYARSSIWNITCGREAIRRYVLSQTRADGLLFLDADMTFDPDIISIMLRELKDYQVIFNGSPRKHFDIGLTGAGCLLIKRPTLEKIRFSCYEFRNGDIIQEDAVLEMDLFQLGIRLRKGFFVASDHYFNALEGRHMEPQKVGLIRQFINNSFIRYCLIKLSLIVHYNIPSRLLPLANKLRLSFNKSRLSNPSPVK
jgi:hypothetical protein